MFLSRLILNPQNRRVQRELANPYELHRTLMAAFPEKVPSGERVLYRVDIDGRSGVPTVLLQSQDRPDWAWLGDPRANGYLQQAPDTKAFELRLSVGQALAFRLRANPTTKRWLPVDKDDATSEKKAMRVPITGDDDLRQWLDRKAAHGGFRIVYVSTLAEGRSAGWQPVEDPEANEKRRRLTFYAVRFDGVLTVTDPEALADTVCQGIGSGKGFGFGLLSLARP